MSSLRDLIPVILVVAFFQAVIIRQPLPEITEVIIGSLLVVIGLMLFVEGLNIGLFPIGESMAYALARKGSVFWLMLFSFLLGFSTTVAEPALIAVTQEASKVFAESGIIGSTDIELKRYSFEIRITVAFSVGFAILLGVMRILKGWPLHYMIIAGYALVMVLTIYAPLEIIGLAFDVGGVTTSTLTVPLVTALGVGLANVIEGRSPLLDGFGLIAFASLFPMIFVMAYGIAFL
jgi:hypothetical protein